jgi:hypothetical protein
MALRRRDTLIVWSSTGCPRDLRDFINVIHDLEQVSQLPAGPAKAGHDDLKTWQKAANSAVAVL